jgi:hypothetical protein
LVHRCHATSIRILGAILRRELSLWWTTIVPLPRVQAFVSVVRATVILQRSLRERRRRRRRRLL